MLILLSCAKTMADISRASTPFVTTPLFEKEAAEIAFQLAQCSVEELEQLLRVNAKIALQNFHRYQHFHAGDATKLPAVLAYTGIVFKKLNPADFTAADFQYAQHCLRLTSFCYGLLRPLDAIHPYRLEGGVKLPHWREETMFVYWRSWLTDLLIADVKAVGGVLCHLASDEMRGLFDWKRVEEEVMVVTPEFHVWKKGKLATVVVYTKMLRGELSRFILKHRIEKVEELNAFSWEGFEFDPSLSTETKRVFVNGKMG